VKKTTVTLSYDAEKLSAIEQYMEKKNVLLPAELDKYLQKLYEKHVPPLVREYIETRDRPDAPIQARPAQSKPAPAHDNGQRKENVNG